MSVRAFAVRTFLWLPACFAAWTLVAPWHAEVVGWLARGLIALIAPNAVETMERSGHVLAFVTASEVAVADGRMGVLVPEVNALLYTYGLPLFAALVLAVRAPLWQLALGAMALLAPQALGVAMGCLVQLVPHGLPGLVGWRAEAVGLGFQLASLVLPGAVPILLWCAWNRHAITQPEPAPPRSQAEAAAVEGSARS